LTRLDAQRAAAAAGTRAAQDPESAKPRLAVLELDESPREVSAAGDFVWVALGEYSHEVARVRDARTRAKPTTVAIPASSTASRPRPTARGSQVRPNQLSRVC
jgi:hypothetical protein